KHAGTGKTLTAAGSVNDGNSGNDYAVTLATSTTGEIDARAITVTALTNTKTYDGAASALAAASITSGGLAGNDTGTFTETYDTAAAGTGKTLTPAGTVADSGSANVTADYNITFAPVNTGVINSALTQTALTSSPNPSGTGQAVILTATVTNTSGTAVTPTGS